MGTRDQLDSGRTAFANATHLPVMKDTVVVPRGGFVRFRFRASNPGYWIFHCHLEMHMVRLILLIRKLCNFCKIQIRFQFHHQEAGMGLIFKVGERKDMLKPPADFPTCGHYLEAVDDAEQEGENSFSF